MIARMGSRRSRPHRSSSLARRSVLVCLLLAGTVRPVPAFADPFDDLRDWIQHELAREDVPSLTVAVARDGRILWEAGFGWANRERQVRATPHTRYSLASVSKPLTTTGLIRLVEQGRVGLDRPVNGYLGEPGLQIRVGRSDEVTVRRVANHTAGLPLHHHFFVEGRGRPPAMEDTLRRYGNIVFQPGERYQYSNLGYGVLDHLITRVASQPYAQFIRDEVFRPLGMLRTSVGIPADERDDYAIRYAPDGSPHPYYEFDHRGASAVFSSAHDLAAFGLFHVGRPLPGTPSILSRSTIADMQRLTADSGHGFGYGIGWQIKEGQYGYRTISHGGGMPGVSTLLTLVPSARLVVVALANASTSLPQRFTERALEALVPVHRLWSTRRSARRRADRDRPTPERRLVGTWTGHVAADENEIPLRLRVEPDGQIFLSFDHQPETRLVGHAFAGHELRGLAPGVRLPLWDHREEPDLLRLVLIRRDDTLSGVVTAVASSGQQIGFALSRWVELARSTASSAPEDRISHKSRGTPETPVAGGRSPG